MRARTVPLLVIAAAALTACGRGEVQTPAKPLVLWSSGTVKARFPIPPEAAWRPVYQRLRSKDEALRDNHSQWACYSSGRFEEVLRFYATAYGFSARAAGITISPAGEVFSKVRREAARLGHEVPRGPASAGDVRSVRIGQRQDLPMVLIESPYLDLTSGQINRGTLISMCWTEP